MKLDRIRSRCYHRCRIILHHRNSSRRIHRACHYFIFRHSGNRLLLCRFMLCRVCFHDTCSRQCLYILICYNGRTYSMDYRLGSSIGIYCCRYYRQYQLEQISRCFSGRSGDKYPPCTCCLSLGRRYCEYTGRTDCSADEYFSDSWNIRKFYL